MCGVGGRGPEGTQSGASRFQQSGLSCVCRGRRGGWRWPGRGAARVLCGHRAQKPLQLGLREAGAQDPVGALAGMGGGWAGSRALPHQHW